MSRTTRALAGAFTVLLAGAVTTQRRRHQWRATIRRIATDEDARRLLHLHTDGLLSAAETLRAARWTRAYEPGALAESLTWLVLDRHDAADRAAAKAAWFTRVSSEIGPHLPTVPMASTRSRALARAAA